MNENNVAKNNYHDVIDEIDKLFDKDERQNNIHDNCNEIIRKLDAFFDSIADPFQFFEICPVDFNRNIGVVLYDAYRSISKFLFIRNEIGKYESQKYLFADIIQSITCRFPPLEEFRYFAVAALNHLTNRFGLLFSNGSYYYIGNKSVEKEYYAEMNIDSLLSLGEIERLITSLDFFCKIGQRFVKEIESILSFNEKESTSKGDIIINKIYISLLSLLRTLHFVGAVSNKIVMRDLVENYKGYERLKDYIEDE